MSDVYCKQCGADPCTCDDKDDDDPGPHTHVYVGTEICGHLADQFADLGDEWDIDWDGSATNAS